MCTVVVRGIHGWWGMCGGVCMSWEACVVGGIIIHGGMHGRGACVAGGACVVGSVHGGGHAWQGACIARGCVCGGGACVATEADGTNPTGMHSC